MATTSEKRNLHFQIAGENSAILVLYIHLLENPLKMDDLGVPPFQETSIYNHWLVPFKRYGWVCSTAWQESGPHLVTFGLGGKQMAMFFFSATRRLMASLSVICIRSYIHVSTCILHMYYMYYLCSIYVLHMPCILHTYQLIGLVSQVLHNPVSLDWWENGLLVDQYCYSCYRPVRESLKKTMYFWAGQKGGLPARSGSKWC